jgi:glycosyltransferase involved in cell wall biosynthesis
MASAGPPFSVVHVVVTDAFAGVERYVAQVAGTLAGRGHRVHTIGGDPDRMRAELPVAVSVHPTTTLAGAARALATLRDVDLVHVHMTAAEGAAWLARPLHKVPVVATRHFARPRGSSAVARALASVTVRAITCDIAISRFVADTVGGSTVLITNGVPHRPQAPLDAPTVVMLQRLEPEKAPALGIEAFARSDLADQGWRLTVAGVGRLQADLEDAARRWGASDSTEFAGYVAETDTLLERASIFLAPGHLDGFGLSVVEAMAHGVPVVAARGGGHLETLGRDGMLFPPGDVGSAADALRRLGDDPALRRSMGTTLRRRQQRAFSLPRHVDRLEALYRAVLEAKRTGRPFDPAAFPDEPGDQDPVASPGPSDAAFR